jgi:hypothetical protein
MTGREPDVGPAPEAGPAADAARAAALHLRFGWWALLGFLTLGIALETMHGFKVRWYLDATNETRRLMFTLAHSHGTLLAVVNVVFALTLPRLAGWAQRPRTLASRALLGATILLPGGFLLGGLFIHGGDPGLGIVLVPAGALLLLVSVLLTARAASRSGG